MGMLHLYCGDGKGKTSAAMGLSLRALGHGKRVVLVQFLKNGTSGELEPLRQLGATVLTGKQGTKFSFQMTEAEKTACREAHDRILREALSLESDLLILDEFCAACRLKLLDEQLARDAVLLRPENRETVLTGRDPEDWMTEAADYITEMRAVRHPYESGIAAREGVEY